MIFIECFSVCYARDIKQTMRRHPLNSIVLDLINNRDEKKT